MPKKRGESPKRLKLRQPDRSAPSEATLIDLAEQRGLFAQAMQKGDANRKASRATAKPGDDEAEDGLGELSPTVERVLETLLWSVSLATLHFTLDVLVHHQFSVDRIQWAKVSIRAVQALIVFALLFFPLHPHPSNPTILPGLPERFQSSLRRAVFFLTSVGAGCYLVYVTNSFGYMAVMKQAPPLGCLWVWSVIELELPWAVLSLAVVGIFAWAGGYSIK